MASSKSNNGYTEAEERSAAFHDEKWLNTGRRERNETPLDNQAPFKKQKEPAPPQRNFRELLRSQLTTRDEEEQPDEVTEKEDFVSLIVDADNLTFYMGSLKALFSGKLPSEP